MRKPIRISAVIPAYNYGRYLGRAIESVLAQTRPVDEVIVIDDGSTDDTAAVAASFGQRVRYIYKENRGLSAARNTGIRAAQGDWLAFLDADDCWRADKIQLQMESVERNPDCALVYTSSSTFTLDGVTNSYRAIDPSLIWPTLRYQNCISGGSGVMVRKDVFLELDGFDETLTACEDWDMWVRIGRKYKFSLVQEPVTAVMVAHASMSSDHVRMLTNTERILEKTLLADLRGLDRWIWRRKIWASQMFAASISARKGNSGQALTLILRSLAQWPSPFFIPLRWLVLGSLLKTIRLTGNSASGRQGAAGGVQP
jgi:glycosyltransferase involved in cell wall biosynthesis